MLSAPAAASPAQELSLSGNLWGSSTPDLPATYRRLRCAGSTGGAAVCGVAAGTGGRPAPTHMCPAHLHSQLRYLSLTNCGLEALPPVVAGLRGLRLLKLNINRLQVGGAGVAAACACACPPTT